jgi:hypothetical protein
LLLMLAAPVDRQEVSWRLRGIGVVVEGDQSSTGEPIHQGPSWLWVRAADGVLGVVATARDRCGRGG